MGMSLNNLAKSINNKESNMYKCKFCNRQASSEYEMKRHLEMAHRNKVSRSEDSISDSSFSIDSSSFSYSSDSSSSDSFSGGGGDFGGGGASGDF